MKQPLMCEHPSSILYRGGAHAELPDQRSRRGDLRRAPAAFAVHEANNLFDLAVTATGPAGADGSGSSIFSKGGTQGNGPVWKNDVRVSGLEADTMYAWVGVAMGTASMICSFTTDASGSGSCSSGVNSRLGSTEIREGGLTGIPVLRAVGSIDDDNKVEDGEIERRGTCRFDSTLSARPRTASC